MEENRRHRFGPTSDLSPDFPKTQGSGLARKLREVGHRLSAIAKGKSG